jgi:hypothetical protein
MKIITIFIASIILVACNSSSKWTHLKFQKVPNTEIFYTTNGTEGENKILLILFEHAEATSVDNGFINSQVISNFVNCNKMKWTMTSRTFYSDHMGNGTIIKESVVPKPYDYQNLKLFGDSMIDKIADDICTPKSISTRVLSLFN